MDKYNYGLGQLSTTVVVPYCRQASAKRSHAGIVVIQWSKNGVFAPQGRHVAHRTKFHMGRNVGIQPQNYQSFEFFNQ